MTDRDTTPAWSGGGSFLRGCVAVLAPALLSTLLSASAWASGLQVTPVLLEFKPGQRAQAVWLSNSGQRPIQAQVRIRAWSQADGGDALEPTNDLVASPPMVEIPAGQSQVVRIVRTQSARPTAESAYRLLVDELPEPASATAPEKARSPGGVQFLFRYLIPIFVGPQEVAVQTKAAAPVGAKESAVTARLTLAPDQRATLTVRNLSPRRVKLSNLSYVDAASGESLTLNSGLFGYVLAGATRQWTLPVPASLQRTDGRLKAKINEDSDETVLAQDPGQP